METKTTYQRFLNLNTTELDGAYTDSLHIGTIEPNVSGGDVTFYDTYDDLRIAFSNFKIPTSNAPSFELFKQNTGGTSTGVYTYTFSPTEHAYFAVQLPHTWKEGSTIYPHLHWTIKGGSTSGSKVQWQFEYTWADIGDIFGVTTVDNKEVSVSDGTDTDKHLMTNFTSIDGTGYTASSMLICRLSRVSASSDEYDRRSRVFEFDLHIINNRIGTSTI
jgi:hypothetical protein